MAIKHGGILVATLALALTPSQGAEAAKPLINLGPKTAPVSDAVEFAAGDDLSKLGSSLVWQNERDAARDLRQVVIPSFQVEFVTQSDLGHRLRYALTSPVVMPDSVVSAVDTTTTASKLGDAMGTAIGVLAGVGGTKTRTYEVTVDPQVWSRDVSAAIDQVGDLMIARLKQDL